MKIVMALNGERREFDVAANTSLLSLLRNEAACFSVKHGCESGDCGACCVIVDGKVVNSCILLAAQADEREVVTLEGIPGILRSLLTANAEKETAGSAPPSKTKQPIATSASSIAQSSFQNASAFSQDDHPTAFETLHPIQQAFVETHAIQCGYCTPGMILSTVALFAEYGLMELPSANQKRRTRKKPARAAGKLKSPAIPEAEIRDALAGNLCRCTGYVKPVEAVVDAMKKMTE